MTKRQLTLPGLRPPRSAPPVTARKDLSESAFERALDRHGIRHAGDLHFVVPPDKRPIEAVCRVNPIRIARRATLAKLIRSMENTA